MSKGVSEFTSNILSQEINAMNIYIHDFMRIQYCSNKCLPINDILIDKNETE